MKKKQEVHIVPDPPSRKRRSNIGPYLTRGSKESTKLSREHLRTIKKISAMAQVPMKRVFSDVIEVGIASVLSSYKPMINMEEERKIRSERLKNLFSEQETSGPVGRGVPKGEDESSDESSNIAEVQRPDDGDIEITLRESTDGLDDADVGPGQLPEADTYIGGVTPNGEIVTNV